MSAPVLLNLGSFQFGLDTAVFEELRRTSAYNWPDQSRLGTNPALQFTGVEADTITLPGKIYPHFRGGLGQVDGMRAVAAAGKPLLLVDGMGSIKGFWCVTRIDEGRKVLWASGAPRLQEFTVELKYYGPNGTDTQPRAFPVVGPAQGASAGARVLKSAAAQPSRGDHAAPQAAPASGAPNRVGHASRFPFGVIPTPIGPIRLPLPNLSLPVHAPGTLSTPIGPVRLPNFGVDLPSPL